MDEYIGDGIEENIDFKPNKLNFIREQFKSEWFTFLDENGDNGSIILNSAPNRIGKTISTLEYYINKINDFCKLCGDEKAPRVLYLSDRHSQIKEVRKTLLKKYSFNNFNHIRGIEHLCCRKEEDLIKPLIENNVSASIVCENCNLKKRCKYQLQFEFKWGQVVGSPKEFLPTNRIQKKQFDYIVIDEMIDVGYKIKPVCPEISEETFNNYSFEDYVPFYVLLKGILDDLKKSEGTLKFSDLVFNSMKAKFEKFKDILKKRSFNDLKNLTDLVKKVPDVVDNEIMDLIIFLNGLSSTFDWLEYCFNHGFRTHFYRPYLHYAIDLCIKYGADLVILNTSLEKHIYNSLVSTYKNEVPKNFEFPFTLPSVNSLLLHYNHRFRSCPKWTIFEIYEDNDGKFRIKLDNDGYSVTKNYGEEIVNMAIEVAAYCKNLELKVGLITFKGAENVLRGYADVTGYFGNHQGSNRFDTVDVLIILGTYHRPWSALFKFQHIVNNEFLKDNRANMKGGPRFINGVRITLTDNEEFNKVILYKLNEEHGQAIFRSGAHVEGGKIVIVFGYVPDGIDEKLDYRPVSTARGAKISIGKWLKKCKIEK